MESLNGSGETVVGFPELDRNYHLKIRHFIGIGMPPVFADLERDYHFFQMRREGVAPIMFYLRFQSRPEPLAFGRKARSEHQVRLFRYDPQAHGEPPGPSRLLMDMHVTISGHRATGRPEALGYDEGAGPVVEAGRMQVVNVLTRPVAPPGERQVTEVPAQLRAFHVHQWAGPFPSVELLGAVPEGLREADVGDWQALRSVWGLPNTDINQHVNVLEYIMGLENQYARMLFAAGRSARDHRITETRVLFRKPFFPGQPYGLHGRLFLAGRRTFMLGAFHALQPEGELEPRPSVFAALEGELPAAEGTEDATA